MRIIVSIRVHPDRVADFVSLVARHRWASLAEPGCASFTVEVRGEYSFLLDETWADAAAVEAHRRTPHYLRWRAEVPAMEVSHERREVPDRVIVAPGCFDGLHAGHVYLLTEARRAGTRLIVALNSDESVRRLKGADRPIVNEQDRAACLRALRCVDEVQIFDTDTPAVLLDRIGPCVIAKGAEPGRAIPEAHGREVLIISRLPNRSTTNTIERIKSRAI